MTDIELSDANRTTNMNAKFRLDRFIIFLFFIIVPFAILWVGQRTPEPLRLPYSTIEMPAVFIDFANGLFALMSIMFVMGVIGLLILGCVRLILWLWGN